MLEFDDYLLAEEDLHNNDNDNDGHEDVDESTKTLAGRCSVKKVFLEISQNSQEGTCARVSFLIKLQTSCLQL